MGWEHPVKKEKKQEDNKPKKRRRPRKGEERPKEPTRLEKQLETSLKDDLEELPKGCDIGCKKDADGKVKRWKGYKLHLDVADGGIPISCVLTSAAYSYETGHPFLFKPATHS